MLKNSFSTRTFIPSSSEISRWSAASKDSPASTLPPGNSHIPAKWTLSRRWVIRIRPFRRMMAATTLILTNTRFSIWTKVEQALVASQKVHEAAIIGFFHMKHRRHCLIRAARRAQAEIDQCEDFFARNVAPLVPCVHRGPEIFPAFRKLLEPGLNFIR